jgi:ubiquinone/menaquinone biosynthesis C-methylase UbiE
MIAVGFKSGRNGETGGRKGETRFWAGAAQSITMGKKKARGPEAPSVQAEVQADYASETYWDSRYKASEIDHEWYYSYETLEPLLRSVVETFEDLSNCKALEIGCGDRPLVNRFHQLGIESSNLYGMDFSQVVVDKLIQHQSNTDEPNIQYLRADARKMPIFKSNDFNLVVDKGTIDAMLSSSNKKSSIKNARSIVEEVVRILTKTGSFILISHIEVDTDEFEILMDDILLPALGTKEMVNWAITAHIVKTDQANNDEDENEDNNTNTNIKGKKRTREEVESQYGTIYIITARPKRSTRNSSKSDPVVDFQVLEYTDSGDEEEVMLCQECNV